jgi:hypothetical protein
MNNNEQQNPPTGEGMRVFVNSQAMMANNGIAIDESQQVNRRP